MKISRKVLVLLIQILIVTLALVMTVGTYAWYTSQREVHVAQTTVRSAEGANTVIESESNPDWDVYKGEDGTDMDENAPYSIQKTMTITFTPLTTPSYLQLNIISVVVSPVRGDPIDSSSTPTIRSNFTWRLEYSGTTYQPDANGFAYYYDSVNDENVYFEISTTTLLTDLVFTLVFLDETSYQHYLAHNANDDTPFADVTPFAYSGYEYMRATFNVTFQIGVDLRPAEEEGD